MKKISINIVLLLYKLNKKYQSKNDCFFFFLNIKKKLKCRKELKKLKKKLKKKKKKNK